MAKGTHFEAFSEESTLTGTVAPQISADLEETFVFPASREQTRYWMLAQLDPESTASNMAIAFEVEGIISDSLMEKAIAALTLRHEALRTVFRLDGGILSQVVLARPLYAFTVEDLSGIDASRQPELLEASVSRHGHTLIDLKNGPVLHAHLIHLGEQRHVIALTMNHIVCDGWSNGILIRDFTILYEAIRSGRDPVLPELPFQFADFSLWQSEYLASPAADEAANFWKSHIKSNMSALDMPTDRPRPGGRSFPGHIESALLPKEIDDRLKDYCRQTGSTKHIVLLTAFEALCARYTGQREFLLGSTIANRTQPGMEDVVGRFANPQIIVAKVPGDPSFAELEQRVRDWETASYSHQDLPFSRIIEDFQIDQAGATSQFLQVWFLYQKAFMQPQAGETIRVTPRRSVSGGVDFDLLVSVVERAEGPRIQFEYNTLIFNPERIVALIQSFIDLLGAALEQPAVPLSQLARTTPVNAPTPARETKAMAGEITQKSLLSFLTGHLQTRSTSLAYTDGNSALTWNEVAQRSASLATTLRTKFPSASTIAVVLSPRVESFIALLAVLRLGVDFMPLPAHTDDITASACVAHDPGAVLLAPRELSSAIAIAFEDFASLPAVNDGPTADTYGNFLFLTDAALLTFAEVPAAALLVSVEAALSVLALDKDSSLLAFAASSPVDSCMDRLLALVSGAQLNFAADLDVQPLAAQIAQHDISAVLATPSVAKSILTSGWSGDRRVSLVVRGERLPASLSALLTLRLKSVVYLLPFAPAGGYIGAQFLSASVSGQGLLPLGENALLVKDTEGRNVPTGAFGELYVNSPFTGELRTGFMARSSTNGIELSDSAERFVQLRGHRVCLGDLEDAAFAVPGIHSAAASVADNGTDAELLLYVSAPTESRDPATLRKYLSEALPSHLNPSDLIWLDTLPLSADGRVNTAKLPRVEHPSTEAPVSVESFPVNDVEEKLSSIWKDVLGLKSIDVHKSFFELGGSSLLLVRLFARVNKAFGTSLPITTIFEAKTVAALARMLGGDAAMSHLVRVQPNGGRPPLFMIHSYLLYQGLSMSLGQDQPFYGLRELEEDGQLNIEQRAKRYVEEIRAVQEYGPYYLAGWCAAGPLTIEVARHLRHAGEEIRYLALFDSWLPGYMESVETQRSVNAWLPYKTFGSKIRYHRHKMRGFGFSRKIAYVWHNLSRMAKEARYRIYVRNWERIHQLSQKYQFSLPQFMHNTSLETFSALKEYHGQRLDVRLILIRASDSREVPGAAPACGWDQIAENGVDVLWAPGDHETMFMGENLRVTSNIVRRGLEIATSGMHAPISTANTSSASESISVLHVDCPST